MIGDLPEFFRIQKAQIELLQFPRAERADSLVGHEHLPAQFRVPAVLFQGFSRIFCQIAHGAVHAHALKMLYVRSSAAIQDIVMVIIAMA